MALYRVIHKFAAAGHGLVRVGEVKTFTEDEARWFRHWIVPVGADAPPAAPSAAAATMTVPDVVATAAPAEPAPEPAEAPSPPEPVPPTASIADLTAADAQAMIDAVPTRAALRAMRRAEERHPRYPGGRATVLRALALREKALG